MNRRATTLVLVSVIAAMILAYGAVTGLATVGVTSLTGTNAIVSQPAVFAAPAGATGTGPVAVDDFYSIVDGSPLTIAAPGVLANDSNAVSVVPVTGPAQGALTLTPTGSFTYDPLGTTGTATFTYKASDGTVLSSAAIVTITISTQAPGTTVIANPTAPDGAALYSASCAACHGADGNSIAAVQLGPTSLTNAQLVAALSAGGKMSAYAASMSATEIQAVADYVGTLGVTPPATTPTTTAPPPPVSPPTTTAPPPPATTPTTAPPPPATTPPASDGAALYAASCAACHGAGGFSTSLSNAAVVAKLTSGSMAAYAGSLSTADIQAVANFIVPAGSGGGGATPPPAGGGATPPPAGGGATPPAAPTTGDAAYAAYCAACHGADGSGTAAGPDIVGESASEIYSVVRQGDGTMPAFSAAVLGDQTLAAIADYIATFGPGTDDGDEGDDDGDEDHATPPDEGEAAPPVAGDGTSVYTAYCAACHGADGSGTALGPDIVGESSSEIYTVVREGDGAMPAFSYETLSDDDLALLTDYIASWGGGDDGDSSDEGGDDGDGDSDGGDGDD